MDAGSNSETNDMKFRIVYDGPALETHEMNVRDLALHSYPCQMH